MKTCRATRTPFPLPLIALLVFVLPSCGSANGAAAPSAVPASGGTDVSPAGGSVPGLGGTATLAVPANAVQSPVSLTASAETAAPLDPAVVPGTAVRYAPAVTFSAPAVLTIRYDPNRRPSGVDESELRVHQLVDGAWRPIGGNVDAAAHSISVQVAATGSYAVRWPEPATPCPSREAAEFDFWIGNWSFSAPNASPGTNDITRESGGCLIQERFRDANGTIGRSLSLLSPLDGRWHQTYVDSIGGRLVLIGGFEDGRMRLYETSTRRFNWLPEGPDRIRYFEERSGDGGATWSVGFDSVYARR